MYTLYDSATGAALGTLTEEEFRELSDQLEEEWTGDDDYYVDGDTIDMLYEAGVSNAVLDVLRKALADKGEADIRWKREGDTTSL